MCGGMNDAQLITAKTKGIIRGPNIKADSAAHFDKKFGSNVRGFDRRRAAPLF
jgi:hypothetical protein